MTRVVSLVPSATELLAFIGADDLLVGRSHECDAPGMIRRSNAPACPIGSIPALTRQKVPVLGPGVTSADIDAAVRQVLRPADRPQSVCRIETDLYMLDEALLQELRPNIILTQDLCGVCAIGAATVRSLASRLHPEAQVVTLRADTIEGVFDDLLTIGQAVGRIDDAKRAMLGLRDRFFRLADRVTPYVDGPTVAFVEWTDPLFIGGHWTPQLVERAGGRHPLNPTVPSGADSGAGAGHHGGFCRAGPSTTITAAQLVASQPERLVVCPCGVGLDDAWALTQQLSAQPWWHELPAVRSGAGVGVVDGSHMFNRPGPRLVDAFAWLVCWLNGLEVPKELSPAEPFPWRAWPGGAPDGA